MRVPGTFNPGGHNNLITLSYLRRLKAAQTKRKAGNAAAGTEAAKAKADATADAKPAEEPSKGNNKTGAEWTAEQDAQLLRLKVEDGAQWKAIASALGKNAGEVKKRWGEIRPEGWSGDKKHANRKPHEEANTKKRRQQEEMVKAINTLGEGAVGPELKPDENFTEEELEHLRTIFTEEFVEFGNALAHRFQKATRRYVHPRDILGMVWGHSARAD